MKIDFDQIVRKFNENPSAFMAGSGALLMGISKVIESVGSSRGSHAYARDVARRVRESKK
jgi:hypothetical protein